MHGHRAFTEAFVSALRPADVPRDVEVILLPPAIYLGGLKNLLEGTAIAVGAQNLHPEPEGAFTGEIAAEMIRDAGATWTLVGHSERRQMFGETDDLVVGKYRAALRAGLRPILCVGETLAEREAGNAEAVVERQMGAVIDAVDQSGLKAGVVAYEPVWAIGTGRTASPAQAQEMHAFIRTRLAEVSPALADQVRIVYGGSVKPDNAADLFAQPDIDGGLVGGASLEAESFSAIVVAASPGLLTRTR
jgi:triosephosphate isomerase